MDILSDVNIVGNLNVSSEVSIDGQGIMIAKNFAIFCPSAGMTFFGTVKSGTVETGYSPIIIQRNANGSSTLNLAQNGKAIIKGELTAKNSSNFCESVYNYSTVYFHKNIYVDCGIDINHLDNYHNGKIRNSFFDSNHVFGETTTIDVPADCTRFFIGDIQVGHTDADFDFRTVECLADYFVYPTISVYRGNKKVDMDIEVDTINFPSGNEGSSANNSFTEVIIGNIKACSSDQQFKVAISPTFQFDY